MILVFGLFFPMLYVFFSLFIISLILPGFSGSVILSALLVRSDTLHKDDFLSTHFFALKCRESLKLV